MHLHTKCFVRQPHKRIKDEFTASDIEDPSSNEITVRDTALPGYATLVILKDF